MAHPDDAEIWCGGALCKYSKMGGSTIVVPTTSRRRANEAAAGAEMLGATLVLWKELSLRNLAAILRKERPDIVITHSFEDFHPEHRAAAHACIHAVKCSLIGNGTPRRLYFCDTYNSLLISGEFRPTALLDISDDFSSKELAIQCHRSQSEVDWLGMIRRQNSLWGARIGQKWAEAYQSVPMLGVVPGFDFL